METLDKPKHGTIEWLQKRHRDSAGLCTLGASDAPALMGASSFTSRTDLWYNKTTEPQISATSPAMHVGNVLEPALVSELSDRLGISLVTPDIMYRSGRFTISLDAADDASVLMKSPPLVIGEVKTTRKYSITSLDDVPVEYLWQIWAQQMVTGADAWLIVLDREMRISTIEIPRNEQAFEALQIEADRFCRSIDEGDFTQMGDIVTTLSHEQIAGLYRPTRTTTELPADALDWVRDLEEARDLRRQADTIEEAAKDHLARLLLDATDGQINGQTVVTWREQAGRESIDTKSLRVDHPDLISGYIKQGAPIRVMRTNKVKGK